MEESARDAKTAGARRVLILGASYGSLLATKLVLAKHSVEMVCLPAEAELFNRDGAVVRMPVKGREGQVRGAHRAGAGQALGRCRRPRRDLREHDLVVLAMQEPQYRQPGVRELLAAVGRARVPCMSIMNMPPLPYLKRIPGLDADALRPALHRPRRLGPDRSAAHDAVQPRPAGLPAADGAAQRAAGAPGRPTSRRRASSRTRHTALLRELEADIQAVRFDAGDGAPIELPVKLKVHDSVFVPLAKWSMLLAGNYRCVQERRHALDQGGGARRHRGRRARCTTGCRTCASRWAPTAATWCPSRSTPRPHGRSRVRRRRRARWRPAPATSSASTAWCSSSPRSGPAAAGARRHRRPRRRVAGGQSAQGLVPSPRRERSPMPWLEAGRDGRRRARLRGAPVGRAGRLLLAACALLAGCASSTAPGAVGVGRPQLLTVAPTEVSAHAASGYRKLSSADRERRRQAQQRRRR